LPASPKLRKTEGQAEHLAVPKGSENIAREAARSAGFWCLVGIITYVGISLVIKIEATKTRLFLVVVVIGVAFGAASLLEHLLRRANRLMRVGRAGIRSSIIRRCTARPTTRLTAMSSCRGRWFLIGLANEEPGRGSSAKFNKDEGAKDCGEYCKAAGVIAVRPTPAAGGR
jgi:hypothetical protein